MLYYLHEWSDHLFALNVFKYITFRSVAAGVTSFALSLIFGNWVIRRLIGLKFGQPIRTKEEVHKLSELHGAKAGTPTMGGVLIIGAVTISTLLWAKPVNQFVWLAIFSLLYLGILGFVDDYIKVKKKKSDGLSGKLKLAAQFVLAAIIAGFFLLHPDPAISESASMLYVPFLKDPLFVGMGGILVIALFAVVIVGTSNAVNLTDGLDGLATGCTAMVAFAYALLAYVAGHVKIAEYLQIPSYRFSSDVPLSGELAVVCLALVGASLGFLWFNCHPAKVFMGDTGSLAIGGMIGVVAICSKQEVLLVLVGGVFVMEALSVIIQVICFKTTGRRIFAMSPLHHHFELKGWKENTVIVRFWILGIMFALLGLATLKLR